MIELDFIFTEEGDYSHDRDKYISAEYLDAAHGLILYGRVICLINGVRFGPGDGAILGFAAQMKFAVDRLTRTKVGSERWSDFESSYYFTIKRKNEIVTVSSDDGQLTSVSWKEFYEAFTNFYEVVKQRIFFEQCPELANNSDVFEWYLGNGRAKWDLPIQD